MTTRRCDHCKVEKDIEEFNWKYKALGIMFERQGPLAKAREY